VIEDIKITTKKPTPTEPDYRKSTPFSDIDETIIREAELDILALENNPSKIYNKSRSSNKKRKHNINIYENNPSVSTT